MLDLVIRKETQEDYAAVEDLIATAFHDLKESSHTEHRLVARLRQSEAFIPQLSLVAVTSEGKCVGHILLTEASVLADDGLTRTPVLALAPLAVLPECQRQGVGTALMQEAISPSRDLGFNAIIVLGHPDYYPRFGFKSAADFGIACPFKVPSECFMALELRPHALKQVTGTMQYAPEFFEE